MTGIINVFLVIVFTILSGIGDSSGFYHGAKIWKNDKLVWDEVVKSGFGYILGITAFWIAIKFLIKTGIVSAEFQTLIWFSITIVGVAILSGSFIHWHNFDKVIAVLIFLGIAFLMFRTGG